MSHSFPDDSAETLQTYLDGSEGFLSQMGAEVCKLTREGTTLRVGGMVGFTSQNRRGEKRRIRSGGL